MHIKPVRRELYIQEIREFNVRKMVKKNNIKFLYQNSFRINNLRN